MALLPVTQGELGERTPGLLNGEVETNDYSPDIGQSWIFITAIPGSDYNVVSNYYMFGKSRPFL